MKKYQENALIKYKLIAHITIFYISQKAFLTKFLKKKTKKNPKRNRKPHCHLKATEPLEGWMEGPSILLFQV